MSSGCWRQRRYGWRMSSTIVVIGGGIAGVSAGYALSTHPDGPKVHLVETEAVLAHHTTGRSAAQYIQNYGTSPTRALTKASLAFLQDPVEGLVDGPLLQSRGVLMVSGPDQVASFERVLGEGQAVNQEIVEIAAAEAKALFPPLNQELIDRALYEPGSADIDVAGLHQAFVRGLTRAGGTIETSRRVTGLDRNSSGWSVSTTTGPLHADLIVNAAGAWGDEVASLAGLATVGLQPRRRTAFMIPARHDPVGREPLVADIDHRWYLKRDGAQYLCSPADETPMEPCDAKPEEIDIAIAIDRINEATTLDIRTVRSSWAGLRTFSPDETMVIGPDPDQPSFIWCVGQGGTGIQTSPAGGQLVADLALDGSAGPLFADVDLDVDMLRPDRFR